MSWVVRLLSYAGHRDQTCSMLQKWEFTESVSETWLEWNLESCLSISVASQKGGLHLSLGVPPSCPPRAFRARLQRGLQLPVKAVLSRLAPKIR